VDIEDSSDSDSDDEGEFVSGADAMKRLDDDAKQSELEAKQREEELANELIITKAALARANARADAAVSAKASGPSPSSESGLVHGSQSNTPNWAYSSGVLAAPGSGNTTAAFASALRSANGVPNASFESGLRMTPILAAGSGPMGKIGETTSASRPLASVGSSSSEKPLPRSDARRSLLGGASSGSTNDAGSSSEGQQTVDPETHEQRSSARGRSPSFVSVASDGPSASGIEGKQSATSIPSRRNKVATKGELGQGPAVLVSKPLAMTTELPSPQSPPKPLR